MCPSDLKSPSNPFGYMKEACHDHSRKSPAILGSSSIGAEPLRRIHPGLKSGSLPSHAFSTLSTLTRDLLSMPGMCRYCYRAFWAGSTWIILHARDLTRIQTVPLLTKLRCRSLCWTCPLRAPAKHFHHCFTLLFFLFFFLQGLGSRALPPRTQGCQRFEAGVFLVFLPRGLRMVNPAHARGRAFGRDSLPPSLPPSRALPLSLSSTLLTSGRRACPPFTVV